MSQNWIKVERGIRYREPPTRKYGVPRHPDRYFVLRLAGAFFTFSLRH